jgi:hypothetical protein
LRCRSAALSLPAPPRVLCYSAETILAEKFEAICSLGTFNSRFKDFYDIREISRRVDFDGAIAAEAFRNTFSRRGTALPSENPASFQPDFEAIGERGWRAFQRRQGFVDAQSFAELVAEITPLVMGVVSLAKGQEGLPYWKPGNGWVNAPRPDDARTFESF